MIDGRILEAIAARLGWRCEELPAGFEGYLAYTAVVAPGPSRAILLLHWLEPLGLCASVLAEGPAMRQWRSKRPAAVVEPICAAAEAWHAAHAGETNVIDAALRARAELERHLARAGSTWFLSVSSDERPWTAVGIGTADHDLWSPLYLEQTPLGVRIQAPSLDRTVTTAAELDALVPELVLAVRAAVEARDRFRARPFRAGHAAEAIAGALSREVRPPRGRWKARANDMEWPSPPRASVFYGDESHTVASIDEEGGRVRVRAGFAEGRPSRAEELTAARLDELPMAAIVAAVRRQTGRLTFDRLREGRRYRVLGPLGPFGAGDVVLLATRADNWRDGETILELRGDRGTAHVGDRDPALAELDLVLAEL